MPKPIDNLVERSFYENIGEQIKQQRKANKISREDLAEKLGITMQSLSFYERGMVRLPVYRLAQICRILHITLSDPIFSLFLQDNEPQLTLDIFGTKKPSRGQKNYNDHANTRSISMTQEVR